VALGAGAPAGEERQSFDRLRTSGTGDEASACPDVSRRAVLAGAVALPVLGMSGEVGARLEEEGAPPPPFGRSPSPANAGEEWGAALSAFREAREGVAKVERRSAGLSVEEEDEWMPAHEAACAAMEGALGRVVRAPAPDLAALGEKMGMVFDFAVEPGAVEPGAVEAGVVAALMDDVRRLAGVGGRAAG
jgi:hypothetical protein